MKLWLISQTVNAGYDTFDSAVVCAEDESEARAIHPNAQISDWQVEAGVTFEQANADAWGSEKRSWDRGGSGYCWAMPDMVSVELIGVAAEGVPKGVVCASYNAG